MGIRTNLPRLQETRPNEASLLGPVLPSQAAGQQVKKPEISGLYNAPKNTEALNALKVLSNFGSNLDETGKQLEAARVTARRVRKVSERSNNFILGMESLDADLKKQMMRNELDPSDYERTFKEGYAALTAKSMEGLIDENGDYTDPTTAAGIAKAVNTYKIKKLPEIMQRGAKLEAERMRGGWHTAIRELIKSNQDNEFSPTIADSALSGFYEQGMAYVAAGIFNSEKEVRGYIEQYAKDFMTSELQDAQDPKQLKALLNSESFSWMPREDIEKRVDYLETKNKVLREANAKALTQRRKAIDRRVKEGKVKAFNWLFSESALGAYSNSDPAKRDAFVIKLFTALKGGAINPIQFNLIRNATVVGEETDKETEKYKKILSEGNIELMTATMELSLSEDPTEQEQLIAKIKQYNKGITKTAKLLAGKERADGKTVLSNVARAVQDQGVSSTKAKEIVRDTYNPKGPKVDPVSEWGQLMQEKESLMQQEEEFYLSNPEYKEPESEELESEELGENFSPSLSEEPNELNEVMAMNERFNDNPAEIAKQRESYKSVLENNESKEWEPTGSAETPTDMEDSGDAPKEPEEIEDSSTEDMQGFVDTSKKIDIPGRKPKGKVETQGEPRETPEIKNEFGLEQSLQRNRSILNNLMSHKAQRVETPERKPPETLDYGIGAAQEPQATEFNKYPIIGRPRTMTEVTEAEIDQMVGEMISSGKKAKEPIRIEKHKGSVEFSQLAKIEESKYEKVENKAVRKQLQRLDELNEQDLMRATIIASGKKPVGVDGKPLEITVGGKPLLPEPKKTASKKGVFGGKPQPNPLDSTNPTNRGNILKLHVKRVAYRTAIAKTIIALNTVKKLKAYKAKVDKWVDKYAGEFPLSGIPGTNEIIKSMILKESGYDPKARSIKKAQGLLQIKPKTAQDIADRAPKKLGFTKEKILNDPETNVKAGMWYLSDIFNIYTNKKRGKYHPDSKIDAFWLSVAAYNHGEGNMRERMEEAQSFKMKDIIDYLLPETIIYVEHVDSNLPQGSNLRFRP